MEDTSYCAAASCLVVVSVIDVGDANGDALIVQAV